MIARPALGAYMTPEQRHEAASREVRLGRRWLHNEKDGGAYYVNEDGNRVYEDGEERCEGCGSAGRLTCDAQAEGELVCDACWGGALEKQDADDYADDLFRIYNPAELLDADRSFRWLLRGFLVHPSYGMVAGEKKTLKSYLVMFINLAVASGTPLFGHFEVDEWEPVVTYVGEGGRIPYTRRLERVAHAMGIDLRHTPLYSSFDVAPIQSPRFIETLTRDLRALAPGLVTLDPLYAFHGAAANSSNLHEEGALLSSMSAPCVNAGASLLVLNHFNKTGGGRGLDRITQAGGQEWADTWMLLSHRKAPDVANGRFKLLLEVGSRQWGGTEWDLDLNVGRFDVELGEFDGDISWELRRHRDSAADSQEAKALALLAAQPYQLTREELAKGIGGNLRKARTFVTHLEAKGAIACRLVTRERSDGRKNQVWAFHLTRPASYPETPLDAEGQACA